MDNKNQTQKLIIIVLIVLMIMLLGIFLYKMFLVGTVQKETVEIVQTEKEEDVLEETDMYISSHYRFEYNDTIKQLIINTNKANKEED